MIKDDFKPEIYYFLADRWFRVIEFSLVIATLDYFSNKTNNHTMRVAYWISYFFFFSWFLELGEYVGNRFYSGKSAFKAIIVIMLTTVPFIAVFILLSKVGKILILLQI